MSLHILREITLGIYTGVVGSKVVYLTGAISVNLMRIFRSRKDDYLPVTSGEGFVGMLRKGI